MALAAMPALSVELKPATVQEFEKYVRAAEARMDATLSGQFLWTDRQAQRRQQVRAGRIAIESLTGGKAAEVPDGLIHDWIGAVFIPGATLAKTLALVQNYDNHKNIYKPEVIDSRLLSRNGNDFKIYLRLLKKKVLTVVLNTHHDVQYFALGETRSHSRSHSTRIAEVENAGRPNERELPPGEGHGFLWRLNSYWRFEERDGGVYVECQAISLTRDVPFGLGWIIEPIVRNLPRESLESTLRATRVALK